MPGTPPTPLEMMMQTPKAGTLRRAVFEAMHARWCGPECPPSCREWHPDQVEQDAAIAAVRGWKR